MENEKRLISYEVLIAHLDSCIAQSKGLFKSVCVAIKCFVEQMPTVDAVEVVRCKDCKWYDADCEICVYLSEDGDTYDCGCDVNMKPDDFCSYGERKDND